MTAAAVRPHVRCVVLVIASSDAPYYERHAAVWRAYMDRCPDVRAFFVRAAPGVPGGCRIEGDTVAVASAAGERFDLILYKTVVALAALRERYDFDFAVRTNLSTLWVWDNLMRFLRCKDPRGYLAATFCRTHDGVVFPSGCGYVLGADLVDALLARAADPAVHADIAGLNDDVAVGVMMRGLAVRTAEALPRHDVCGRYDEADAPDDAAVAVDEAALPIGAVHVRNRLWSRRHRETVEVDNARRLLWFYHGVSPRGDGPEPGLGLEDVGELGGVAPPPR